MRSKSESSELHCLKIMFTFLGASRQYVRHYLKKKKKSPISIWPSLSPQIFILTTFPSPPCLVYTYTQLLFYGVEIQTLFSIWICPIKTLYDLAF